MMVDDAAQNDLWTTYVSSNSRIDSETVQQSEFNIN